MNKDLFFMRKALLLAKSANPSPNPRVGAVIVNNKKDLQGSTLYVTLEPCNHYGKTPPCTDAIIKSGIKKIIIACQDPHKIAQGGISRLKKAGIKIKMGVLEKEAEEINMYFFYAMTHKRPNLIQKSAITFLNKVGSFM